MRILIVGPSGAGKSTLARRLGARLGLPVIHLDAYYWRAGWREPAAEEWGAQVAELVARDAWIMEGNNSGPLTERMAAADTIVFLDLPAWRCVAGVYVRWWKTRGREREDLAPGCPETLPEPTFLTWIYWDYPRRSRPRLLALLAASGKPVVTLRSRAEAERYVRSLAPL